MEEHDYKKYPELTNAELAEIGLTTPFPQITEDFYATAVKVHDGDTITLRCDFRDFDFPLRFSNIDAPELNTGADGQNAQQFVEAQVLNEEVKIIIDKKNRVDKWGRLLGRVISRGLDVGEAELQLGYAKIYGKQKEGEIPIAGKIFSMKQWF